MSLDTYIQMGQVHTSKDRTITETELGIIQKDLNDHCKMILNIFMIGVGHGEHNVQRVKAAFTTLASEPAVLWLMPKDHKVLKPGQPMPSRALVSIKKTLLSRTSKLITNMVKAMADLKEGSNEIKSGENMKAGFDETNARYKEEARMKARGEKTTPEFLPHD